MNEGTSEIEATKTLKEIVKDKLLDCRKIGFATYCLVTGVNPPSEFNLQVKNIHPKGDIDFKAIQQSIDQGLLYVAIGMQEQVSGDLLHKDPTSVLQIYGKLLDEYFGELKSVKKPLKSSSKTIAVNFPELSNDPLFDQYWQVLFPVLREDKAHYQYLATHLRSIVLGFADAAREFDDQDNENKAMSLVVKNQGSPNEDALVFTELIDRS